MGKYSKLIAAVVGVVAVILGPDMFGLTDNPETVVQSILGLLTVLGVYQVKNKTE